MKTSKQSLVARFAVVLSGIIFLMAYSLSLWDILVYRGSVFMVAKTMFSGRMSMDFSFLRKSVVFHK